MALSQPSCAGVTHAKGHSGQARPRAGSGEATRASPPVRAPHGSVLPRARTGRWHPWPTPSGAQVLERAIGRMGPPATWRKGSPNVPDHPVSIEFNRASHRQFDEVAEELKRKNENNFLYEKQCLRVLRGRKTPATMGDSLVSMVWETPGTLHSRPIIEHQRREWERRGVAKIFFGPISEMMRWTVWCLADLEAVETGARFPGWDYPKGVFSGCWFVLMPRATQRPREG